MNHLSVPECSALMPAAAQMRFIECNCRNVLHRDLRRAKLLRMTISTWLSHAWAVLALFLIPIGGGIPAGVLLAKSHGLAWPITTILYFISDVILAFIFEPLMWLFVAGAKRSPFFARIKE